MALLGTYFNTSMGTTRWTSHILFVFSSAIPTTISTFKPSSSSPVGTRTYAPSQPHIISLSLFMTIDNWPSTEVTASSEEAIIELISSITGCDNVRLDYNITQDSVQLRKLATTYSFTMNVTLTAMSSSMSSMNTKFVTKMNTAALVNALNTDCGCTLYSGVTIAYISSDYYCVDSNTPTSACSYGTHSLIHILISLAHSFTCYMIRQHQNQPIPI